MSPRGKSAARTDGRADGNGCIADTLERWESFFGTEPTFLAQLEVTYRMADQRDCDPMIMQVVTRAHSWPRFQAGEDYDARQEVKDGPGRLDEGRWMAVRVRDESTRAIEAKVMDSPPNMTNHTPKRSLNPKPVAGSSISGRTWSVSSA